MIRKLFTLLLVLIPIVLITSCQRQLPASIAKANESSSLTQKTESHTEQKEQPKLDEKDIYSRAKGINKNKDAIIIQSDENRITEQQDNNKKFFTLKDPAITEGRVINAQRNILLFDDGRLYYGKIAKETKEPVLCLIAEHVKQMGTQPGMNENTSPEFQTDDGRFWRYSGDGTDLEPELLTDEDTFKDYTIKGQNMIEDTRQETSTAPWSRLFSFFQTGRHQSETFGYQLKDATESNYHDEEIFYFYLNQQGELDYRKIDEHSPKVFLPVVKHQDYTIEKFQANYFNPDTKKLQVSYLYNNTLSVIDDLSKNVKLGNIRSGMWYYNVRDFWRGPMDTIILQRTYGKVLFMRSPFEELQIFPNIKPSTKIKNFVYFPSERGLDNYKYAYVDMDGKLHDSGAIQPQNLDEYGIPKMNAENQAYYDKYLEMFHFGNPFVSSFSNNNFDFFVPCHIYSDIVKSSDIMEVPLEEVENTLMQYFPISAEQIRKSAINIDFNEDKTAYIISRCPDDYNLRGVVIAREINENVLTLTCDWYNTSRPDADILEYYKYGTSQTKIQLKSDGTFFYESNQFTRQ